MGSWFSNLHIRRNADVTETAVMDCIVKRMRAEGYYITESQDEADSVVTFFSKDDSQWISVCSDTFAHDDPESCARIAEPFSAELHTDVLGISCFDSDYLYLNLINSEEQLDAWIGIGSGKEVGITRRSNLTAWKKKVKDYPAFSAKAKEQYVCAEEFLAEIESCIGLPMMQSATSLEDVNDRGQDENVTRLHFKRSDNTENHVLPRLQLWVHSMLCSDGESSFVEVLNHGGEGRGLSVFFVGPYVEHEEITFRNVMMRKWVRGDVVTTPIQLQKVRLLDGQWAYYYHDPKYRILPKARDRAPVLKQKERSICVDFTPAGNPRKMLDITVVFVPDQNPTGQTGWNAWYSYGSKKAFIKSHNEQEIKIWKRIQATGTNPGGWLRLLKEEDFD